MIVNSLHTRAVGSVSQAADCGTGRKSCDSSTRPNRHTAYLSTQRYESIRVAIDFTHPPAACASTACLYHQCRTCKRASAAAANSSRRFANTDSASRTSCEIWLP